MTLPPSRPATTAVILAAGLGTRMRSRIPKVLHPICGRPMLAYVIDAAREATGSCPLVVYSPATAAVCEAFAGEADFALQDEPRGTGDALRAALEALPGDIDEIVVLNGDAPLIESDSVTWVASQRREAGAPMALAVLEMSDAVGHGRVLLRDHLWAERIVEEKDATEEERAIEVVNAGLYAFDAAWLRGVVARLTPSPATGELYLTQLVEIANDDGARVIAVRQRRPWEFGSEWVIQLQGVNDRGELADAAGWIQADIVGRLMRAGVTIQDVSTAQIDATVELAEDVTLEPNVILRGATRIARDTVIRSGSQIADSIVGERCEIWASVLESAVVEDDVRIGPFAHLRPGAHVGQGAEIGNFAEIKQSRLGPGTKQHHFSYIGDADVGARVNIGAGTITANFDGHTKSPTHIGDDAFIGSDTILRAPVTVGEGSVTGAGSVVTRDVPPGKLAVGVPARIRERRARGSDPPEGGDPA